MTGGPKVQWTHPGFLTGVCMLNSDMALYKMGEMDKDGWAAGTCRSRHSQCPQTPTWADFNRWGHSSQAACWSAPMDDWAHRAAALPWESALASQAIRKISPRGAGSKGALPTCLAGTLATTPGGSTTSPRYTT